MDVNKIMVSIILVSYNRKKFLEDTIRYCLSQTLANFEIIVVDASEQELKLTDEFISSCGNRLKYINWDEVGNISRQRNTGIKASNGEYLLFVDDDVKFEPNLIEVILKRFDELKADALTGIIEASHRKVSKEVKVDTSDPMLYLGQPSFHQNDFLVQTYLVSAACFAVTRKALLAIGGFDEQVQGVFDDSDVGIRLTNAGYLVYHDNAFSVYHFAAKNSGSRSPKLGPVWKYANICYLQMKHFYQNDPEEFYDKSIRFFLRPSGYYLNPFKLLNEIAWFKQGFAIAKERINEGPKNINV
jgi:GT2 family glycosyltransferase